MPAYYHTDGTIAFDFIIGTPDPREMSTNWIQESDEWYDRWPANTDIESFISPNLLPKANPAELIPFDKLTIVSRHTSAFNYMHRELRR